MHPDSLRNVIDSFRAFKEANAAQEPREEGVIPLGNEDASFWMRGGYVFFLRGDALEKYNAFLAKWNREPWKSRWCAAYRLEKIQDAIVSAWNAVDDGAQAFESLAAAFDAEPKRFTVWTPLAGINLQTEPITIGRVTISRLSREAGDALIADVTRIAQTLQNADTEKAQLVQYVTDTVDALIDTTCAIVESGGDSARSQQLAEEKCVEAIDLLQFFAGVFMDPGRGIRIDFRSFEATGFRPTLMLSIDKTEFVPNQSRFGAKGVFTVNSHVVARLKEWNLDQLFDVFNKNDGELTDVERLLKRAIHWFADGDLQRNAENALQSYVTCLDMFFSSRNGDATVAVQDGVTFLLGNDFEQRQYLHRFIGEAYNYRSRASHEGEPFNLPERLQELRMVVLSFIREVLVRRGDFAEKKTLRAWVAMQRLK